MSDMYDRMFDEKKLLFRLWKDGMDELLRISKVKKDETRGPGKNSALVTNMAEIIKELKLYSILISLTPNNVVFGRPS